MTALDLTRLKAAAHDVTGDVHQFARAFTPENVLRFMRQATPAAVLELVRRLLAAEAEAAELRAEVREWLCEACNTVYPGPPQRGFMCVVCPKCKGTTGPRVTMEKRRLEARIVDAMPDDPLYDVLPLAGETDECRAKRKAALQAAEGLRKGCTDQVGDYGMPDSEGGHHD